MFNFNETRYCPNEIEVNILNLLDKFRSLETECIYKVMSNYDEFDVENAINQIKREKLVKYYKNIDTFTATMYDNPSSEFKKILNIIPNFIESENKCEVIINNSLKGDIADFTFFENDKVKYIVFIKNTNDLIKLKQLNKKVEEMQEEDYEIDIIFKDEKIKDLFSKRKDSEELSKVFNLYIQNGNDVRKI